MPFTRRGAALVAHFFDRWEGPKAGDELPALLRAAATHEVARERIVAITVNQATPLIGAAVIYVAILWPLVRLTGYAEARSRRSRTARQV